MVNWFKVAESREVKRWKLKLIAEILNGLIVSRPSIVEFNGKQIL